MTEQDRPEQPRDGERRPHGRGAPRKGSDGPKRDGDRQRREGDQPRRDGQRPYREGERPRREGDRPRRDGDRPYRDGQRPSRDGQRPRRDGERPSRDGQRPHRDGDRPRRDGDRPRHQDGRPARGGRDGQGGDVRARDTRPRIVDPALPEDLEARDLDVGARAQLKTLSKDNADRVARHLAMAARSIDTDPALAHEHALAAARHAGRVAVVRESVAITAYATGDFALALRELRTYRRISGRNDQIALIVDSERGVGRPDRALQEGRDADRSALSTASRVELAIAMSGARLDTGEPELALAELDIPELDPAQAFPWSPGLFAARAAVLAELGRDDEAAVWQHRAEVAEDALDEASGGLETIEVDEIEIVEVDADDTQGAPEPESDTADESPTREA